MPVDNNMPHGNHFASNGPRPDSVGSSANGNRHTPAPDTTEAFMMASRSGRTAKQAPAQPVASPGVGASMGGRSSHRQQSNTYQQQSRTYAAGRPADSVCAGTVAEQITSMRDTVNGPVWTIASFIPVYGDDIKLVRGMMEQADILAQDAMLPACAQLEDFKLGNLLTDGAVNIEMLKGLITTIQDVEPAVISSIDAIDALPEPHIGKINALMDKVTGPMDGAKVALKQVNGIPPILPQMLDADGPRNYLITAENNSGIRACGGFIGSLGVMNVDNGKISLGDFEGTLRSSNGPKPQITITDEEMTLLQPYEPTMNFISGDVHFTPEFPKGASNVGTLWSLEHGGQHIDGVVALDPVFLQYLLQLCDGVTAADGAVVDGPNAANELLSGSYWRYPEGGDAQDAGFASVASGAFNQLLGGLGEVGFTSLFKVIKRGGDEGRLLMWMANDGEENAVVQMGFDGALNADTTKPQTGVFVNNYSHSKLDWHLNPRRREGRGRGERRRHGVLSHDRHPDERNERRRRPAGVRAANNGDGLRTATALGVE